MAKLRKHNFRVIKHHFKVISGEVSEKTYNKILKLVEEDQKNFSKISKRRNK